MGPTEMGDLAGTVSVPSLLVTDTSITFWELHLSFQSWETINKSSYDQSINNGHVFFWRFTQVKFRKGLVKQNKFVVVETVALRCSATSSRQPS